MNSLRPRVVFTSLQFTSYRCYGEESFETTGEDSRKSGIEPGLQPLVPHSRHNISDRAEAARLGLDVFLQ